VRATTCERTPELPLLAVMESVPYVAYVPTRRMWYRASSSRLRFMQQWFPVCDCWCWTRRGASCATSDAIFVRCAAWKCVLTVEANRWC